VTEERHLIESHAEKIRAIKSEVAKVVVGQEEMIHLMIYTLFSKGHILLEGVPGLAKSLAVETFAKVIGGDFKNPIEQIGTYPLAESQVDRFMVKVNVGYPDRDEETELIRRKNTNFEDLKESVRRLISQEDIPDIQKSIHDTVKVSGTIMDYIINICLATRPPENEKAGNPRLDIHSYIRLGASPRGTESLLALAKAHAFGQGRDFVGFEDVNACAVHVLRHRILLNSRAISKNVTSEMIVEEILGTISPY